MRALISGAVLLLLALASGCATTRDLAEVERRVAHLRDDTINAEDGPVETELEALAQRAFGDDPHHHVALLHFGDDALLARIHVIRAARETVDVQTWLWDNDATGTLIFNECVRAARRGVKVRLLVDHMGTVSDTETLVRIGTGHANLDVKINNVPFGTHGMSLGLKLRAAVFRFRQLNRRMHNKMMVVDGRYGIAGGRNIGDRYFDYDPDYTYKDRDVLVVGEAARQMKASFDEWWGHRIATNVVHLSDVADRILDGDMDAFPKGEIVENLHLFPELDGRADRADAVTRLEGVRFHEVRGRVEYVSDSPDKQEKNRAGQRVARTNVAMQEAAGDVSDYLLIQSPYMVLSNRDYQSVRDGYLHNPGARLIYSTNSLASTNAFYIWAFGLKDRETQVGELGIEMYELKANPGRGDLLIGRWDELCAESEAGAPRLNLHAKGVVVDGKVAIVGSHNFDPRSHDLNTECLVLMWDEEVARDLEEDIRAVMDPANSWVLARKGVPGPDYPYDMLAYVSSRLPVFDVVPRWNFSAYELREGMEPTVPSDPAFRERYEPVGSAPDTRAGTRLKAWFVKAFGGLFKPLL